MKTMTVPGFTAAASLYGKQGRYQSRATGAASRATHEVISQSRQSATNLRNTLGFGQVHCASQRVCLGYSYWPTGDGRYVRSCDGWTTVETNDCYWWPY